MLFHGFKKEYDRMPCTCPQCQSEQINTHNYAKRTCGAVGTVAGAVAGAAGCISGAEIGAMAGFVAGPAGAAIGGIAGAVIGGLLGGATGCAAGVKLGEVIDDHVLDNYHCLECHYTFSNHRVPTDNDTNGGYAYPQDRPYDIDENSGLLERADHSALP
jgi:hypothetical protein